MNAILTFTNLKFRFDSHHWCPSTAAPGPTWSFEQCHDPPFPLPSGCPSPLSNPLVCPLSETHWMSGRILFGNQTSRCTSRSSSNLCPCNRPAPRGESANFCQNKVLVSPSQGHCASGWFHLSHPLLDSFNNSAVFCEMWIWFGSPELSILAAVLTVCIKLNGEQNNHPRVRFFAKSISGTYIAKQLKS